MVSVKKQNYYTYFLTILFLGFIAFIVFIAIEEGLRFLLKHNVLFFDSALLQWMYIPKAALAGLILILFRKSYKEINLGELGDYRSLFLSISSGILVFLLYLSTKPKLAFPVRFKSALYAPAGESIQPPPVTNPLSGSYTAKRASVEEIGHPNWSETTITV